MTAPEFTFTRKEDSGGSHLVIGRVFTNVGPEKPKLPDKMQVLTAQEAEQMQVQQLEQGLSAVLLQFEKFGAMFEDLTSKVGILLDRVEANETKTATLTRDVEELAMQTEPIEERA